MVYHWRHVLSRLRNFAVVADAGSVLRAATRLRVAQPALTRQIRQLEEEVGAQLFERGRRGVELTPAGSVLLDATRTLFERVELAVRHAHEADEGTRGLLRVGLGRIAIEHPTVGRALAAGRARYPELSFEVKDVASWDQPFALRSRELDIAIGAVHFRDDEIISSDVLCEDVVDTAVVPSSHPLASHRVVSLEQLFELRHLTLDTPLGAFPRVLEALTKAGLKRVERHATVESVYNMVAAGRGWTCAPHSMRLHPPVGTTLVTVRDLSVSVPIHVGWRTEDGSHAITNIVCALLEEMGRPCARHRRRQSERKSGSLEPAGAAAIELEHLRTLAAVIADGSVSRAAERLHLSQPGVTRRLHALSRATGLDLTQRVSHGVLATPAGSALGAEADEIMRLAHQAMARARHAAEGITGSYSVAMLPLELAGPRGLEALQQIQQRLPHIEVTMHEMISEQALRAVTDGRVHVALLARLPGLNVAPELASVQVDDDAVSVLVPESHPLSRHAWLTAADLANEPFVFVSREAAPRLYDCVMRALEAIGLCPRTIGTFDGPRPMWRAAVNESAWTIGRLSQRSRPPAGLVAVPLEGFHVPCGDLLVWRRDERDAGVRELVEVFRQAAS